MLFGILLLHRRRKQVILRIVVDHCLGKNLIIIVAATLGQTLVHESRYLIHI